MVSWMFMKSNEIEGYDHKICTNDSLNGSTHARKVAKSEFAVQRPGRLIASSELDEIINKKAFGERILKYIA